MPIGMAEPTSWRDKPVESLMPNSTFETRSDLESSWLRKAAEAGDMDRLQTVFKAYVGNIDAATRVRRRDALPARHPCAMRGHLAGCWMCRRQCRCHRLHYL